MDDEGVEPPWQRTVVTGLGALAVVAVLLGVMVGLAAVGAARVSGVGDSANGPNELDSLYIPPYQKTPQVDEGEPTLPAPRVRVTAVPLDPTTGPPGAVGEITLYANPTVVSPGERVNLNGLYLDGEGVRLQVQRLEGDAWIDFPTTVSVRNGGFGTYISTGRPGENVFRVFDPTTGRSSPHITVTVG